MSIYQKQPNVWQYIVQMFFNGKFGEIPRIKIADATL